jgi:hypothetical protein
MDAISLNNTVRKLQETVFAVGYQAWNINVDISFTSQKVFTVVWYSVTDNGQLSGSQFCHRHNVVKYSCEEVCVMFLHQYFCLFLHYLMH